MQNFRNFSANQLNVLFSKGRISSYTSINQHFDNFDLVAQISKNIGIAEVLLRNKIDCVMCGLDSAWIDNLPQSIQFTKPKEANFTRDKIVSIQSLGFWVRVAEHYRIEGRLFSKSFLDSLDFRRYYAGNANNLKDGSGLRRYYKANLLLHLLRNLRNRAFHFENLYKLNDKNKPRLIASIENNKKSICVINLATDKIQVFLDDLINELSKRS